MTLNLATIRVGSAASEADLKSWTDLVCPNDLRKPSYVNSQYECECGFRASTWQKLARVIKGTSKILTMPKLAQGNGAVEIADMYRISMAKFVELGAADCIDSKDAERPVICDDAESAKSLYKIMVAQESGQSVIILRWNDTTEQVIAMLALTPSGRIVLRKLIPKNLVRGLEAGLRLDISAISRDDVDQVKVFLKNIPEATEKTFEATDYRITQFDVIGTESNEDSMVVAMEKMLEKVGITGKANKKKEKNNDEETALKEVVEDLVETVKKVSQKISPHKAKQKIKVPIPISKKRK